MATNDPFPYTQLKLNEIRLVVLEPRHGVETQIRCSLLTVDLASQPRYAALSYVWGERTSLFSIVVDGLGFEIGHNLYEALHSLSQVPCASQQSFLKRQMTGLSEVGRKASDRVLSSSASASLPQLQGGAIAIWTDAICINQDDLNERNGQVAIMDEIFTNAEKVVAWLGGDLPEGPDKDQRGWARRLLARRCCCLLANQPYWDRVWIIQEILLARQLEVRCGQYQVNWKDFRNQYESCAFTHPRWRQSYRSREDRPERASNEPWPNPVIEARCSVEKARVTAKKMNSLASMLTLRDFKNSKCSVPQDRVFALLGIVQDCCKKAISLDYSIDMRRLALDVHYHDIKAHVGACSRLPALCDVLGVDLKEVLQLLHADLTNGGPWSSWEQYQRAGPTRHIAPEMVTGFVPI